MNSLGYSVCVCVCVKRKGKGAKAGCLIVTHHSYESLFTTDGSPFPWVFFMPQWFIKENYNIYVLFIFFFCPMLVLGAMKSKVTLRHESQAAIVAECWWHLRGIFLVGVVETWLDFFIFSFPFLPPVTGEGRKGIPGIIGGGGGGGGRPVIHNACYLTQHTDLLLTRTGLYLQDQCHHMTTVHDKALLTKRRVNTVQISCNSTG